MPATTSTSWAEIDLSALRQNVSILRRQASPAALAAVVKADAYGHGAIPIARAAIEAGASRLCVFTANEAVELRQAGIDADIICLGPVLEADPPTIASFNIASVVDSEGTAGRLDAAAREADVDIRVHLNLDAGMQRYGRPHDEAEALAQALRRRPRLTVEAVFTHFPDAGNPERTDTLDAFRRFQLTADRIGAPLRHAAASAATFHHPETVLDFVRAGVALYGVDPAPELAEPEAGRLRPVLSWRTRLLSVRDVSRGESVSYGRLWTAERDSRIGVIGAGYADGLRRALSLGGELLVVGQRAPIRGAICMDTTMIDLTNIPQATAGDIVTIIGHDGQDSVSAWDLARRLGTIPYEIFTSITARVPRIVLDPQA
ncbi:MAG: alanine racemase [Chloroflexi bacterium]|nr:alanine racemase [Chloroflexota bacterium]